MFYHPFSNTLYDHYEAIHARLFHEREECLASLKNRADAEKHIQRIRTNLAEIFALPARPAPECRITGTFEANGTLVDKLLFRCSEERWCSGWFIRLEGHERRPAALVVCGHSLNGKFEDAYQMVAFTLARKGFGVMFMDPLGQGEMVQHRLAEPLSPTDEHNYLGRFCTLEGVQLCTYFVNDACCVIDNLLARPEILPGPVCVTGNSGGGQMTYYLHALDDRVQVAAASCHMNTLRAIFRDEIATDAESSPAGLIAARCDRPDFGIAGAPKPLLLIGQDNDFVDLRGLKKACSDIQRVYDLLDCSDSLELFIGAGDHGFVKHCREAAYGFLTKHIMGKVDSEEPEDIHAVAEDIRQVTPTGRVIDMPGMVSLPELFQQRWQQRHWSATGKEIQSFLVQQLQLERFTADVPDYRILRPQSLPAGHGVCCRWVWHTDSGSPSVAALSMLAPSTHVLIPTGSTCRLIVAEHSAWEELGDKPEEHERVFALDMRGIGLSESEAGNTWGTYEACFGREYFLDNTARLIGESLAGGRVRDLLSAIALLRSCGYHSITLEGSSHAALMIAYACGATETIPEITEIILNRVPLSFAEEDFSQRSPVFLFGMLKHFDLQDLYAHLKNEYRLRLNGNPSPKESSL